MEKSHPRNKLKIILIILLINISFAFVAATQCNDGIDNDGDNKIDALVELNPNNNQQENFGNTNFLTIFNLINNNSNYNLTCSRSGGGNALLRSTTSSWNELISQNQLHETADKACNILGYREGFTSTCHDYERSGLYPNGKCNFDSPNDDCLWYWTGTSFQSMTGTEAANNKKTNSWITELTCQGKLAACNDGIDNDGDGNTDLADSGCASENDNSETRHDPDCQSPTDNDESTPECTQNSDCSSLNFNSQNFCDQDTVYYNAFTYSCSSEECEEDRTRVDVTNCAYGCTNGECQEPSECKDNTDNDNDGLVDAADPGCWNDPSDSTTYNPNLNNESRYNIECDGSTNCCGSEIAGDLSCQGNNIMQEILQKLCHNPNTGLSYCDATPGFIRLDYVQTCNYDCRNGECFGECNVPSDCGSETISDPFCGTDGNVHETTFSFNCEDYTCEDDGGTNATVDTCNYGCNNGECYGECNSDSECSSQNYDSALYCATDGNAKYDSHEFTCEDYGCSESITTHVDDYCDNSCNLGTCLTECKDNTDNDNDNLVDAADPGCWDDPSDSTTYNPNLNNESRYNIECDGSTNCCGNEIAGDLSCQGNNIMQEILQKLCHNPNTGLSYCDATPGFIRLDYVQTCNYDCRNGECFGECNVPSDCGSETPGQKFCESDNNLYQFINGFNCNDFTCENNQSSELFQDCGDSGYGEKSDTYCIDNSVYYNQTFYTRGCESEDCFETEGNIEQIEEIECPLGSTCEAGQCLPPDTDAPLITLLSPQNNTTQHDQIGFNFSAEDDATIRNCSLNINNALEETLINVLKNQTISILFTPSIANQYYNWSIECFDIYNNQGVSETRTFYYTDNYCEQTSDCNDASEDLICQGDNVTREIITPLCQLNNTCAYDITYEFVRECNDGCLNGHCRSDPQLTTYDDNHTEENANNFNPYSGSGSSSSGGGGSSNIKNNNILSKYFEDPEQQKTINTDTQPLNNNTPNDSKSNKNWLYILLFILFAGIILFILLIIYVSLR